MGVNKYERIIRATIDLAERQALNEASNEYMKFLNEREYYKDKILELYKGNLPTEGEFIDRYEFLEEFYDVTGLRRIDYLDICDTSGLTDEEELVKYELISEDQKQTIKDFLSQDKYKDIRFSDIVTLMRFEKKKEQYQVENIDISDRDIISDIVSEENHTKEDILKFQYNEKYKNPERILEELAKNLNCSKENLNLKESDISIIKQCLDYEKNSKGARGLSIEQQIEKNQNMLDFFSAKIAASIGNKEEINEDVFQVLYNNKYEGKFADDKFSEMYKKYCEEQDIKKEEQYMKEQTKVTKSDKDEEIEILPEENAENKEEEVSTKENVAVNYEETNVNIDINDVKENNKINPETDNRIIGNLESKTIKEPRLKISNNIKEKPEEPINTKDEFDNVAEIHSEPKKENKSQLIINMRANKSHEQKSEQDMQNTKSDKQQELIKNQSEKINEQQNKISEITNIAKSYKHQVEILKDRNAKIEEINSRQLMEIEALKDRCNQLGLVIKSKNQFIDTLMKNIEGIKIKAKNMIDNMKPKSIMEKIAYKLSGKREELIKDQSESICNITDDLKEQYNSNFMLHEDSLTTDQYVRANITRAKAKYKDAPYLNTDGHLR